MNPLKWLEQDIHIDMSMCIRMRVSISWIPKVIYQLEIVKHVCWKWMMYSNQSLHFMLYYIVNESLRDEWLFYSLNSPTKPAWKAKDKALMYILSPLKTIQIHYIKKYRQKQQWHVNWKISVMNFKKTCGLWKISIKNAFMWKWRQVHIATTSSKHKTCHI